MFSIREKIKSWVNPPSVLNVDLNRLIVRRGVIEVNGIRYVDLMHFSIDGNTYYLFADVTNPVDFMFRKEIEEKGEIYFVKLKDCDELTFVAMITLENLISTFPARGKIKRY